MRMAREASRKKSVMSGCGGAIVVVRCWAWCVYLYRGFLKD